MKFRKNCTCLLLVCLMLIPVGVAPLSWREPARAASTDEVRATSTDEVQPNSVPNLGYGFMLAHTEHLPYLQEAGFDWFKYYANWDEVDGNRDRVYNWETVDWRLNEACKYGLNLLLRVGRKFDDWTPIRDSEMDGWQAFFHDLTAHINRVRAGCSKPYAVALEIWNEPNLDFQWNYEQVNPAHYTEMVKRAYRGAKAADPQMPIVAGSLAPTGGMGGGRAMNDVEFLHAMYAAGLKGHFDAISIHNYGFGRPPEEKAGSHDILNFRRAEDIYAAMVAHGDGDKRVWGTEMGWLLASHECNGYWHDIGFAWQQVSAQQQADYLVRAFKYAQANWPWMDVLIVSNLEFSVMPWYGSCDPLRWFSVLDGNRAPRPAYTALAQMEKRPMGGSSLSMDVTPAGLSWMMTPAGKHTVSRTVTVHNTGSVPFRWTASVSSGGQLVTLSPAEGDGGSSFTVTLNPASLPLGTHSATIRVEANTPNMPDNPRTLPVRVTIVETIFPTHLPLIMRAK
jgi:hypothetical protein